jgi:vitamin B12 transporter
MYFLKKVTLVFALGCVACTVCSRELDRELDPVVVSGSKIEQSISDVLPSISVITRQDIERAQAAGLADLLQGEPGFEMTRAGGPGQLASFYLRGENSTSLAIFIDGIRSSVDGYGNLTAINIPLSTIDRIEILRGNSGALYGEAANGGVINIFTRQSGNASPSPYGSASIGSRRTEDFTVGYGGRVEDTKFNLLFSQNGSNEISTLNTAQFPYSNPHNGSFKSESINTSITQIIDKNFELGGVLRYFTNNASYGDPQAGPIGGGPLFTQDGTDSGTTFNVKTTDTDANLFVIYQLNENWKTRLDLSDTQTLNNFYSNADISALTIEAGYNPLNGITDFQNRSKEAASKWFNTYKIGNQQTINFGLEYKKSDFDNGIGDAMYRSTLASFAGYNQRLANLDFQLNARNDTISVSEPDSSLSSQKYSSNTGLVGIGYFLTDQSKFTATSSNGFRAPSAGEIFGYPIGYGANVFNPNLRPEMHFTDELGLTWVADKAVTRVVRFNSRTTDEIQYAKGGYENLKLVKNQGWEFSERANVLGLKIIGAYTLQNPIDYSTGQTVARKGKEFGSIDINKPFDIYDVGAKVIFSGSRSDLNYTTTGSGESVVLTSYQVWNFYVGMKIDSHWSMRFKLENAFNQNYQLVYGYNTMGRGALISLNYH